MTIPTALPGKVCSVKSLLRRPPFRNLVGQDARSHIQQLRAYKQA
jgi:hypothetical protein